MILRLSITRLLKSVAFALVAAALLAGCASTGGRQAGVDAERLMAYYRVWHGTPYAYGGSSPKGVDCSAFVQLTYREVFGRQLPRSTEDQAKVGDRVRGGSLKAGDLVFFKTGWFKYHVGIYVGGGRFIHASESRGVIQSSLDSPYWSKRYWKARRVV